MLKCLGGGAWPRWEEVLRVAWPQLKSKMSKGQEDGWIEVAAFEQSKSQRDSTPRNLSSLGTSTCYETCPLGEVLETPEIASMIVGLAGAGGRPREDAPHGEIKLWGRAGEPRLFWFIWSHQSKPSCRAQCRQWHDRQPGFAEQEQEKPILQMVAWVTTGMPRPNARTCTKSTGQHFSSGSGFHLRENPNFTVWYKMSWRHCQGFISIGLLSK